MNVGKIGLWYVWFLWIVGASSMPDDEDYVDVESGDPDYFEIVNGDTLYLNETYCLDEISASVLSSTAYGNRNKSLFYIRIAWFSKSLMMSIKVESNSLNDSYCEAENKHYYNRKPLNQTVHVFPDDVNEGIRFFPIKLDCKYVITPELEGACKPVRLTYTAPGCIDNETCSCRNVDVPTPTIQANLENDGVTVFWSLPKNAEGNASKILISIYEEDGINIKKVAKRKLSIGDGVSDPATTRGEEHFRVNVTTGNSYRIQSYFENRINCHGNSTFLWFRHYGIRTNEDGGGGSSGPNERVLPFAMAFTFLFLFVLMSFLFVWKKQIKRICRKLFRREPMELANVEFYTGDAYHQKTFLLPEMDSYWFDYRDLVIVREIGKGNFGVVFLATSSKTLRGCNEFAVKQIKDRAGPEDVADFMEEINTFKLVGSHPNVVKMFGYCAAPHPLTIIMEYVPFNLLKYLKNLRAKFDRRKLQTERSISYAQLAHLRSCSTIDYDYISQSEVESVPFGNRGGSSPPSAYLDYVLDNRDLQVFGLQIARGMAHLEARAIVHRDLAARNVLMDGFKNLKISDFGMSRTGIYVNKTTRKFPLRWMSPEALVNRIYSNKTDVWSFGVVLWEIGTLGAFPYASLQNEEVIAFLKKGGHLDKPDNVTSSLYDVMVSCWTRLPEDRPTFGELVDRLERFGRDANGGYVDFGSLTSNYVFPPMEEDVTGTKDRP